MRRFYRFVMVPILLGITWFYAQTIDFGLIWDDPNWFGRVADLSLWQAVLPRNDYQFFRPATMAYNRLFWQADGTLAAAMLHWMQVIWHVLNVTFIFALTRQLRLGFWTAVFAGVLVGLYPFSYQAVAWAAPQQPMTLALQNGAWLAYLAARRQHGRTRRAGLSVSYGMFALALLVQESTVTLAAVPLLLTLIHGSWPAVDRRAVWRKWVPPLGFLLLAGAYAILWLLVPRQSGFTALRFDPRVWLYLFQGVIYPILIRPSGYLPDMLPAVPMLSFLMAFSILLLLGLALYRQRGRVAFFAVLWVFLGIAPGLFGLAYDYVSLSPRLLYYAAPGVAWLWGAALWPGRRNQLPWSGWGVAALGVLVVQSGLLLAHFHDFYQVGVAHMNALLTAIKEEDGRYLFLNFPDQYLEREPLLPVGNWGLPLAPVVQELGGFPAALTGHHPQTASRAMPWVDEAARRDGPFHVDMRGVILPPEELPVLAADFDAIFVSRYEADGRFTLHEAGFIRPAAAEACSGVRMGDTICLEAAAAKISGGQIQVKTVWRRLPGVESGADDPQHLTFLMHLGSATQPLVTQADGDLWQGTLPLFALPENSRVTDYRVLSDADQGAFVRIGIYNWVTGERLPVRGVDGRLLPENVLIVPVRP